MPCFKFMMLQTSLYMSEKATWPHYIYTRTLYASSTKLSCISPCFNILGILEWKKSITLMVKMHMLWRKSFLHQILHLISNHNNRKKILFQKKIVHVRMSFSQNNLIEWHSRLVKSIKTIVFVSKYLGIKTILTTEPSAPLTVVSRNSLWFPITYKWGLCSSTNGSDSENGWHPIQ